MMKAWAVLHVPSTRDDTKAVELLVNRGLKTGKVDRIRLTADEAIELASQLLKHAVMIKNYG